MALVAGFHTSSVQRLKHTFEAVDKDISKVIPVSMKREKSFSEFSWTEIHGIGGTHVSSKFV